LPIFAVGQKAPPEKRFILRLWRVRHKSFFISSELRASGRELRANRLPGARGSQLAARYRVVP
jgi:hypothetical protein